MVLKKIILIFLQICIIFSISHPRKQIHLHRLNNNNSFIQTWDGELNQEQQNEYNNLKLKKYLLDDSLKEARCLDGSTPGYYAQFLDTSQDYIILFEEHLPCINNNLDFSQCIELIEQKHESISSINWSNKININEGILAEERYQGYNKIIIKQCDGTLGYGWRAETINIDLDGEIIEDSQDYLTNQLEENEQQNIQDQKQYFQNQDILNQNTDIYQQNQYQLHIKGYKNVQNILDDIEMDFYRTDNIILIGGNSMLLWTPYIKENVNKNCSIKLIIDNSLLFSVNQPSLNQLKTVYDFAFIQYKPNLNNNNKNKNNSELSDENQFENLLGQNILDSVNDLPIFIVQTGYNLKNYVFNYYNEKYYNDLEDEIFYNLPGENQISDGEFENRQLILKENYRLMLNKYQRHNTNLGFFVPQIPVKKSILLQNKYYDNKENFTTENFTVKNAIMHWIQFVSGKTELKHQFIE